MNKWMVSLGIAFITLLIYSPVFGQEQDVPSYAKWSKIAMQEVKGKYPNDKIVDFLHIERETKGEQTTEKFKLWLRGEVKEFGVLVDITFNTETEEVQTITLRKTER
ncbi:DUF3889 domain-containing protein [Oceanobacillus piezotolerans]|uniref:DUF3889 domain-containing protein n=1 Tax=Oceanobacillus piezotolerans TaxID=2448030 RepID=A0A498DAD7_9BACI|nr:DUF3889 domain-containing protein [Oceanobacillus piezotolerans]RLL41768.1 DUF3889 domain-containing protein [Oceanobacillus piezotolerans]